MKCWPTFISLFQDCLNNLESGMKDSLVEVYNKSLKKLISQPDNYDGNVDDTILK